MSGEMGIGLCLGFTAGWVLAALFYGVALPLHELRKKEVARDE